MHPKKRHEESNMPKKVLIALPPAMLEQVDFIAQCEHRTRSDLIREALRRYLDNFRRQQGGAHLSVSTMEVSDSYSSIPAASTTTSST
jgi:metal-responsive CopG/Arc/MetJ family transcriptional regulator